MTTVGPCISVPAEVATAIRTKPRPACHENRSKANVGALRNRVGGELPTRDSAEFRLLFDKWRLFLFRRVLIRLRYAGKVASPDKGWTASSDVEDFTEEHNSFTLPG